MTTMNFLKDQVIETRNFTKRLISEMPEELWYEIPNHTDSNFAWQMGHLFLAQNYHIISCAFGEEPKISEKLPIRAYARVFGGLGSPHRSVGKDFVSVAELKDHFDFVFDLCIDKLQHASDEILKDQLEPTLFKNPIALNKYEAISWSFKHEMWHCAEMEQIKIHLGKQFTWIK
jgi:hypothetical protein